MSTGFRRRIDCAAFSDQNLMTTVFQSGWANVEWMSTEDRVGGRVGPEMDDYCFPPDDRTTVIGWMIGLGCRNGWTACGRGRQKSMMAKRLQKRVIAKQLSTPILIPQNKAFGFRSAGSEKMQMFAHKRNSVRGSCSARLAVFAFRARDN